MNRGSCHRWKGEEQPKARKHKELRERKRKRKNEKKREKTWHKGIHQQAIFSLPLQQTHSLKSQKQQQVAIQAHSLKCITFMAQSNSKVVQVRVWVFFGSHLVERFSISPSSQMFAYIILLAGILLYLLYQLFCRSIFIIFVVLLILLTESFCCN